MIPYQEWYSEHQHDSHVWLYYRRKYNYDAVEVIIQHMEREKVIPGINFEV